MTKGEELFAALNGVRDFLNDLGQLLVAGDMLMAGRSWEPFGDNSCLQGLSYGVYEGRRWLPRAALRRYGNAEVYPSVVAMISLLLGEDDYTLTEPLVCGMYFVFPDGTPDEKVSVDPWNALWPGWREATPDGAPKTIDENDEYFKHKWGWKHMQMFARPLVDVTNQDKLKELIIDPLLTLIAGHLDSPAEAAKRVAAK